MEVYNASLYQYGLSYKRTNDLFCIDESIIFENIFENRKIWRLLSRKLFYPSFLVQPALSIE